MNRRHIPAAVGAAVLLPQAAHANNPQQQIADLRALVLDLQARLVAQEQWRAGVEAVWPQITGNN